MTVHLKIAKRHLNNLRENNSRFDPTKSAEKMRSWLQDSNATLADIGSSEEELSSLLHHACLQRAKDDLAEFQAIGRPSYANIDYRLQEGGLSYADIGTSQVELDRIVHQAELRLAAEMLQKVREVSSGTSIVCGMSIYHIDNGANAVRQRVKRAQGTLADIGTSETELQQLVDTAAKNVALKVVERLRCNVYNYSDAELLEYCIKKGVTFAELQSNQTEIDTLVSVHQKLRAEDMLKDIRNGKSFLRRQPYMSACVRHLRTWLAEHHLMPSDIGTSAAELERLAAS